MFLLLARRLTLPCLMILWLGAQSVQAAGPIRIECIGDSTTAGYTDNPSWDVEFTFGYRQGLYKRMIAAGYSIQYVGNSPEPWSGDYGLPRFIGDPDLRDLDQEHHRGYAWMTSDVVRTNIVQWMAEDNPDLILLMIGRIDFPYGSTSNVKTVENSLSNLVEKIVTERPQVNLIVSQITPFSVYLDDSMIKYNQYIRENLVPSYASKGKFVSTVDLYSDFLLPGGNLKAINTDLFADGWQHANPEGNDILAQTWFEGIRAIYPQNPPTLTGTPTLLPNGHFHAEFTGSAGVTYQIDRATSASGPWEVGFTNLTANASGVFDLEDPNPGPTTTRFYRVATPQ